MDKKKKRVREHAKKHGMSYQAAWNQLEGSNELPPALEFWKWMDYVKGTKDCLTLGDLQKLKAGDRLDVLVMDRNLCDHVYPRYWRGETHQSTREAQTFFKFHRDGATYIHEEGVQGRMVWGWDKEREERPFTFHIEFKADHWYPFNPDGSLPSANEPYESRRPEPWDEEVNGPWNVTEHHWKELPPEPSHWTEYGLDTKVGWRGPMMRWNYLKKQPMVFTQINLDRMAGAAVVPLIEEALNIEKSRMSLSLWEGKWRLIIMDLTDFEELEIQRRFSDIEVMSRAAWLQKAAPLGAGK